MSVGAPLDGLTVLEVSSFVAAPLGGLTLAQLGADVIRIDPVGGGPDLGRWPLAAGAVGRWPDEESSAARFGSRARRAADQRGNRCLADLARTPAGNEQGAGRGHRNLTLLIFQTPIAPAMATSAVAPNRAG